MQGSLGTGTRPSVVCWSRGGTCGSTRPHATSSSTNCSALPLEVRPPALQTPFGTGCPGSLKIPPRRSPPTMPGDGSPRTLRPGSRSSPPDRSPAAAASHGKGLSRMTTICLAVASTARLSLSRASRDLMESGPTSQSSCRTFFGTAVPKSGPPSTPTPMLEPPSSPPMPRTELPPYLRTLRPLWKTSLEPSSPLGTPPRGPTGGPTRSSTVG